MHTTSNTQGDARVNIKLDIHTDGEQKSKELPFKLLVVGDFSAGNNPLSVAERDKHRVNADTISEVMNALQPKLDLKIDAPFGKSEEKINAKLTFKSLADFHPDTIVTQIPELAKLVAMRNLLKDLQANQIDNQAFCSRLNELVTDSGKRKQLSHDVSSLAPMEA